MPSGSPAGTARCAPAAPRRGAPARSPARARRPAQLDEARVIYPDAQFIVIVRKPEETLPSWFKLLSYLSMDISGEDYMSRPRLRVQIKTENKVWFRNQIEFCRTIPPRSLRVILFDEFYRDIPGNVRKIYAYFGREIVPGAWRARPPPAAAPDAARRRLPL